MRKPTSPDFTARMKPAVYRPAIEQALLALARSADRDVAAVRAALKRIVINEVPFGAGGKPIVAIRVASPGKITADDLRRARAASAKVEATLAKRKLPANAVRANPGPWAFLMVALRQTRELFAGPGLEKLRRDWLGWFLAGKHEDLDLSELSPRDYPEAAHPAIAAGTVMGKRGTHIFGLIRRDDNSAQVFAVDPRFRVLGEDVVDFVEQTVARLTRQRSFPEDVADH